VSKPPTARSSETTSGTRVRRVLVVEPDSSSARDLVALLTSLDVECELCRSLATAAGSGGAPYDAVLLSAQALSDAGLPALAQLREAHGGESAPPLIAVLDPGRAEAAAVVGVDDCISKPLAPGPLREVLARWVVASPSSARERDPELSAVLDFEALDALEEQMPEMVRELVELFVGDAIEQLQRLRELAAAGEAEPLRRALHRLKGGCFPVGASALAECCRAMEAVAAEGDVASLRSDLPRLEALVEESRSAYVACGLLPAADTRRGEGAG